MSGVLPGGTSTTEAGAPTTTEGTTEGTTDDSSAAPTDPEAALSDALSTLSGLGFTQEEIDCLARELVALGADDSATLQELDPTTGFEAFSACGIGLDRLAALAG
jgi:hypothetical protein